MCFLRPLERVLCNLRRLSRKNWAFICPARADHSALSVQDKIKNLKTAFIFYSDITCFSIRLAQPSSICNYSAEISHGRQIFSIRKQGPVNKFWPVIEGAWISIRISSVTHALTVNCARPLNAYSLIGKWRQRDIDTFFAIKIVCHT